ncbi:MAG: hypothetical protein K0S76_160 [Herbinix sp.]|jgi:hypothetical protein|nr:hypothetical protein [Herbinix sp.]
MLLLKILWFTAFAIATLNLINIKKELMHSAEREQLTEPTE